LRCGAAAGGDASPTRVLARGVFTGKKRKAFPAQKGRCDMAEHHPGQRNIVVKLRCNWAFKEELMSMLRREFGAEFRSNDPFMTAFYERVVSGIDSQRRAVNSSSEIVPVTVHIHSSTQMKEPIEDVVIKYEGGPLQYVMLGISTAGSLWYILDRIQALISKAQRKRESQIVDDPVLMGYEGESLENIDEFVERLLEDEE